MRARSRSSASAYRSDAAASPAAEERDLAFADTIIANDLEPAPPSGVVIHDPEAPRSSRRHVPLSSDPGVVTRLSTAFDRVRYEVHASRVEMNRLWSETATVGRIEVEDDGIVQLRPPTFGRRLHLLLSFFEWDRDVLLRAAWIGFAVFVLAATVGAVFLL